MKVKIAPSILSCDFSRLGEEVAAAQAAGADLLHADIMDGVFVPSLSFGPLIVAAVRRSTSLPVAAHLMVREPDLLIEECVKAGASSVTVHLEACLHLHRVVERIRALGASPGVALNPATPVGMLESIMPFVESVTVMTVNPGYAGQEFIREAAGKIGQVRSMAAAGGRCIEVVVDGGITGKTASECVRQGASILVAGSFIFGSRDIESRVKALRNIACPGCLP
ncbi:MAG: ribulose-phosphate 3-epimerase [Bacillota bacterium]|nr:ribulose-phosphate 3-epimerase [Bacillota bacterium]